MTDLIHPVATAPIAAGRAEAPALRLALLGAVVLAAALAGALAAGPAAMARAEAAAGPELTRLLRAMTALKLLFAVPMLGVFAWRLASPAAPARLGGYLLAAAAVAAGPGLVFGLVHLRAGALLLHAGLIGGVLLLWSDREVGARLARIVQARRAALRGAALDAGRPGR